MLRLLAGARFQALFHSPPGVLFTFPSRYWSTVGRRGVLSLGGRSPLLPAGFLVPGGTLGHALEARAFAYGALTLCRAPSHASSAGHVLCDSSPGLRPRDGMPSTPAVQRPQAWHDGRFGLAPVRSPLLGGSLFDFLSSGYLDVSVPPVAPGMRRWKALAFRVPPFGHPGIEARVRLPRDFRGLPRPSSAPCAKASAVRPEYPRGRAPRALRK